ncbi:hypothetical protein JB92DRAFT_3099343 [Gautieria morchelliformis]|nr:hypothetical protein JB92DRAFT_3099343 [Gautieria morchelliformis]
MQLKLKPRRRPCKYGLGTRTGCLIGQLSVHRGPTFCLLMYGNAGLSLISYMADAAMEPVPVLLVLSPEAVRCSTRCITGVLLAKLHLYGVSARFGRAFSSSLQSVEASSAKLRLATEATGTAASCQDQEEETQEKYIVRNPKPGTRSRRNTWRHDKSSLKRRLSHVGETVVIRILWGRRRASDTQSRQNKGQENATDRITGAPARGVEGRRTGKKMGGMAPMECPPEPAIFHYESVPSHGDPRSSSISGSLKSHDCLNWSGER